MEVTHGMQKDDLQMQKSIHSLLRQRKCPLRRSEAEVLQMGGRLTENLGVMGAGLNCGVT